MDTLKERIVPNAVLSVFKSCILYLGYLYIYGNKHIFIVTAIVKLQKCENFI